MIRTAAHRHSRALYRAGMADGLPAGLGAPAARRVFSIIPPARFRRTFAIWRWNLAADMMAHPEARADTRSAAVGTDDRGDRALHAMAKLSGLDPRNEHRAPATGVFTGPSASMRSETRRGAALESFAREAGLVARAFFPSVRGSVGVPPKVYLNVVRMERAVDAVLHQIRNRRRYQRRSSALRNQRISPASSATTAGVSPSEFRNVSRLAS